MDQGPQMVTRRFGSLQVVRSDKKRYVLSGCHKSKRAVGILP
jgi:hypothetical protein